MPYISWCPTNFYLEPTPFHQELEAQLSQGQQLGEVPSVRHQLESPSGLGECNIARDFNGILMGFIVILMGFYSDSMGFYSDSIGDINGILPSGKLT